SLVLIVLADQLGRSIGDMYRGAIIPGLGLTALYIAYVIFIAFFKPKSAPAIPPEARTFIEPNGSHGTPSLLILMAISVVAGVFGVKLLLPADAPVDETVVMGTLTWGATAFVLALLNKGLRLGLLSRIAE